MIVYALLVYKVSYFSRITVQCYYYFLIYQQQHPFSPISFFLISFLILCVAEKVSEVPHVCHRQPCSSNEQSRDLYRDKSLALVWVRWPYKNGSPNAEVDLVSQNSEPLTYQNLNSRSASRGTLFFSFRRTPSFGKGKRRGCSLFFAACWHWGKILSFHATTCRADVDLW